MGCQCRGWIFHSSPDVGTYIKYLPTHSRKLQRYLGAGSVSHGNGLTITRVPISGCYSTYQWKYVGMVRLTSSIAELVCEYFRVYTTSPNCTYSTSPSAFDHSRRCNYSSSRWNVPTTIRSGSSGTNGSTARSYLCMQVFLIFIPSITGPVAPADWCVFH